MGTSRGHHAHRSIEIYSYTFACKVGALTLTQATQSRVLAGVSKRRCCLSTDKINKINLASVDYFTTDRSERGAGRRWSPTGLVCAKILAPLRDQDLHTLVKRREQAEPEGDLNADEHRCHEQRLHQAVE